MTRERIISNIPTGVAITCPTEWAISALTSGGYWRRLGFKDIQCRIQVDRMTQRGVLPIAAERYVMAMMQGVKSRSRAIEIIADRDVAHWGKALDIIDVRELPGTRRHRNAWRRSANGGPVWIDDSVATRIDEARMWAAYLEKETGKCGLH